MDNDGTVQGTEQQQEPEQLGVKETIAALRAGVEGGEVPREVTQRNASDGGVRSTDAPEPAGAEDNPLVVEVPGTGPDDAPIRLELESAEDAAKLRDAIAGGESASSVAQMQQEYALFEDLLVNDPAYVAYTHMTPEGRADLAKLLMADEAVAEAVASDSRDPAQIKLDAMQRRDAMHQRVQIKQYARAVAGAVDRLIPPDFDDERARVFHDDVIRDLAEYVRQNGGQPFPLDDLLTIVAHRLELWGIDPGQARVRLAQAGRVPVRSRPAGDGARDRELENAKQTGKRLAAAGAARRALAAMPGAGAGARPTRLEPPPKQSVQERIKWLRQKFLGR